MEKNATFVKPNWRQFSSLKFIPLWYQKLSNEEGCMTGRFILMPRGSSKGEDQLGWALAYSYQKKQTHLTHIRNPPVTPMPEHQTYFTELGRANFLLLTKRKRTVTYAQLQKLPPSVGLHSVHSSNLNPKYRTPKWWHWGMGLAMVENPEYRSL